MIFTFSFIRGGSSWSGGCCGNEDCGAGDEGCWAGRGAGDPGAAFVGEYSVGTPEGREEDEEGVRGGRGVMFSEGGFARMGGLAGTTAVGPVC